MYQHVELVYMQVYQNSVTYAWIMAFELIWST